MFWFKDTFKYTWVQTQGVGCGKHLHQDDSFLSLTVVVCVEKGFVPAVSLLYVLVYHPVMILWGIRFLLKHLLKQFVQALNFLYGCTVTLRWRQHLCVKLPCKVATCAVYQSLSSQLEQVGGRTM